MSIPAPLADIVPAQWKEMSLALELAITRQDWKEAAALMGRGGRLDLTQDTKGQWLSPPLVSVILAGQPALARQMLTLYPDPARTAAVALQNLTRMKNRRLPLAHQSVSLMVAAGADPNSKDFGNTPPLEAALVNGHAEIALALVAAGARASEFANPVQKIVHCALAAREITATTANGYLFSPLSWELLDVAIQNNMRLPPLMVSSWGSRHFQGFDKFSGQLDPADAARIQAFIDGQSLSRLTPTANNSSPPARL